MSSAPGQSLVRQTVVVTLIVAGLFAAIEGSVRLFWPQNLRTDYLSGDSIAVVDDELGHRLRPDMHAAVHGPEFAVEYRTNGEGLRDEGRHPLPVPAGTTRILVLGDSFAYGSGNAYEDSWATLVERRLLEDGYRVDVVKAGVPGYDTRTEALYLERIFASYDPDIVLLTFLPNDLFTNQPIESAGGAADDHVSPTEGRDKGSSLHSLFLLKRLLMANDGLYTRLYLLTKRREYFSTPPSAALRGQIEVTQALLARMQSFCRKKGRELAVLSIPQQFQVLVPEDTEETGLGIHDIDRLFAAFAEQQGFAWLATLPEMRETYRSDPQDLFYRFDGHLNRLGNRWVADYLARALTGRFPGHLSRDLPAPTAAIDDTLRPRAAPRQWVRAR
jgi:lysophospholipase L1-like esterase